MQAPLLYINTNYNNVTTLDISLEQSINDFGKMSWADFLQNILGLNQYIQQTKDYALNTYGIQPEEFCQYIDEKTIERHYAQIAHHIDYVDGPAAKAYDFISEFKIITLDEYGCGSMQGIELIKTTADGPSKELFIDNERSAYWLQERLSSFGTHILFKFI
jgi:hypothetical protein